MAKDIRQATFVPFYRRRFVVDRQFQLGFVWRLLGIVLVGALVFMGLFSVLAKGMVSVSYDNYDIRIGAASRMLMPQMLMATAIYLVLTGLTVSLVTILLSHRMTGPLVRIQRTLMDLLSGNLSIDIRLRKKDCPVEVAETINHLAREYASKIDATRARLDELERAIDSSGGLDETGRAAMKKASAEVRQSLAFFRTSGSPPA